MNAIDSYQRYVDLLKNVLPLSVNVDVILLLAGLKDCLRVIVPNIKSYTRLLDLWTSESRLCYQIVSDAFLYIGTSDKKIIEASILDQSLTSHENALGKILGYPECCSYKISKVGEENIDSYENWLVTQPFLGEFRLIDPRDYRLGKAFISHVPCSSSCAASLVIAKKLFEFLLKHKTRDCIRPWLQIVE